jgi:hypothetical protein
MIAVAAGTPDDFDNLNAFVAAAIKDAFYRPDLTPEEIGGTAPCQQVKISRRGRRTYD